MLAAMIDYMIIGLVIFFGLMGLVSGVLLQGLRVVIATIAIWVSLTYAPVIAGGIGFFQRSQMLRDYGLPVLMFAILFMLMAFIVKLLIGMVASLKKGPTPVSRVFGFFAGALLGVLLGYFIVSVGLAAEDSSGRRMVALSGGKSHFVELVRDHRFGDFSGSSERREMEVRVKQAADSIRQELDESKGDSDESGQP